MTDLYPLPRKWQALLSSCGAVIFFLLSSFQLFAQPVITAFSPTTGSPGTTITITGTNLQDVTAVTFAGRPAASFTVLSPTSVSAVIDWGGESGDVSVTAPGGTGSLSGFTYTVPPPEITSVTPDYGRPFDEITITGRNFEGVLDVLVGQIPVSPFEYTVISPNSIRLRVPPFAIDHGIRVQTKYGHVAYYNFFFIPFPPEIDSISPQVGPPGTEVTIYGRNFFMAHIISFGGVPAANIIQTGHPEQIKATVGSGASGKVRLETTGGMVEYDGFTITSPLAPPVITSFSPTTTTQWQTVVITGQHFTAATGVSFGGHPASFTVDSDTQITATVGLTGASGDVTVTTPSGSGSLGGYTWIIPEPRITGITPSSAGPGTEVTIKGYNFSDASAISFGGVPAAFFSVTNIYEAKAIVGAGASGDVSITTPGGTGTYAGFTYINELLIQTFNPASAGPNKVITVKGTGFADVTAVTFGGVPAASFTIVSDSVIQATTGNGASGDISVQTPAATKTIAGFTFLPLPEIGTFSPAKGAPGTLITLHGSGFTGATAVTFGGMPAASFSVVSDTEIQATIGSGASGDISIQTPAGTQSAPGFIFTPRPVISSFSPMSGGPGTVVTINGENFTDVLSVSFGDSLAQTFNVTSAGVITATIGKGMTGPVKVSTAAGRDTFGVFTYTPPPEITSFTPISGDVSTPVTIRGSGFTGTTAVYFGGTRHSFFNVMSDSVIIASPGSGSSGDIRVETPYGVHALPGFTYIYPPSPPRIWSFTPLSATTGDMVIIKGASFKDITKVSFGGVPAASFVVTAVDTIKAIVGVGASGELKVENADGVSTANGFSFIPPVYAPVIVSFAPAKAAAGTQINILGSGFTGATAVSIGGSSAASFTVTDDSRITAIVAATAGSSGTIRVTTPHGEHEITGFTFIPPTPEIHSFSPLSGGPGTTVTIQGVHFKAPMAVSFGNLAATSVNVTSSTTITATVGTGASGNVTISSGAGADTLAGFTFIPPVQPPAISSYSPATGQTGTVVTIAGNHFNGVSAVSFGGVPASGFTVVSTDTIKATVGNGASGDVKVEGAAGSDIKSGFIYIPPVLYPAIQSFSPTFGGPGTVVTIKGTHFTGATAVLFGGRSAASFVLVSDSSISAVVDSGATGEISVTTSAGVAQKTGFTYVPPRTPPVIQSFTPQSGGPGTVVVIRGEHFTSAPSVWFGNQSAALMQIVSENEIRATVSAAGESGAITVNTAGGSHSMPGFTFIRPPLPPQIDSFFPESAAEGEVVTILGSNFSHITKLNFGGVPSPAFSILSEQRIEAVVGSGGSGGIYLQTAAGADTVTGFEFVYRPPSITSFSPVSGERGTVVTIIGKNLKTTSAVSFGSIPATFTVVAKDTIKAVVGGGATGPVSVTNPGGTATQTGFTFITPDNELSGYPNPAVEFVMVNHPVSGQAQIQIRDMSGNLVRTQKPDVNAGYTKVDLGGLKGGYYRIVWTDGASQRSMAVILQ